MNKRKYKYNKEFEDFRDLTLQVLKSMDRVINSLDNERAIELKKQLTKDKQDSLIKECFHYNRNQCSEQIIKAHSIQRKNRLFLLEGDVNGNKLLYTLNGINFLSETNFLNKPVTGKLVASTFSGFCGYHDKNLFSPIEDHDFNGSEEHMFLHSYRTYAYSYHKLKEEGDKPAQAYFNMTKHDDITAEKYAKAMDAGYFMKDYLNRRMAYQNKAKDELNQMLKNKDYSKLKYFVYYIDGKCSIATATATRPSYTYKGKAMFGHKGQMPLMLTVLPDQKKSFVILAAFKTDRTGVKFLKELERLAKKQIEIAISSLMLFTIDGNVFFAPAFWEALGEEGRTIVIEDFISITIGINAIKGFFKSTINFFDDKYLAKNLGF